MNSTTRHSSSFESASSQRIALHADVVELTQSPSFRSADSAPYLDESVHHATQDVLDHTEARQHSKQVMYETLANYGHATKYEQNWQMRRAASLAKLGGTALGSFDSYFQTLPSESYATDTQANELPQGEVKIIQTNSRIVRLRDMYSDDAPVEFLDAAIDEINDRKRTEVGAIGPENYATALKFFADKYVGLAMEEEVDQCETKKLVGRALSGFLDISKKDAPNFIEMTNVYTTLRVLPEGIVDAKLTRPLIEQSLQSLPEYPNEVIAVMLSSIPKLNLAECGESTAELIDLAVRKSKKFERRDDFRTAIRAVSVLPRGAASDRAVRTVLQYRNNLEQSFDLESADEAMVRIRKLADEVVGSDELYRALKQVAERMGQSASERTKRDMRAGVYTQDQIPNVHATFARMMQNYNAI